MSPALFAVVDAVLLARAEWCADVLDTAASITKAHAQVYAVALDVSLKNIGAWRALWGRL